MPGYGKSSRTPSRKEMEKEIRADIETGKFRPVYLITGEEAFLRHSLVGRLKKAIAGDNTMNCLVLREGAADPVRIRDAAETLPFFADRRVIVVEDSGLFTKNADPLPDYIRNMPDTASIVFDEEKIRRDMKLYKAVSSVGLVTVCTRLSEGELAAWAAAGLASEGKKIRRSTMDRFLEKTGDDMENIRNELAKLVSYTEGRNVISDEDVEAVTTVQISELLTNQIYDMVDAVADGQQQKALDLYYDLLRRNVRPQEIIPKLEWQFHSLLEVQELSERRAPQSEMLEKTGFKSFRLRKCLRQTSRFSRGELERDVRRCMEMDAAVKSGDIQDRLAAEVLLAELSERHG